MGAEKMQADSGYGEDDIPMNFLTEFRDAYQEIVKQEKEAAHKKKAIDRISWEAERQQRYQKGGKNGNDNQNRENR